MSQAIYCLGETPLTKMVRTPFHESMSSLDTPLAVRVSIRRRAKSCKILIKAFQFESKEWILISIQSYLKSLTRDGTRRLVSVFHVVDVAQELQFIIHGGNDSIQAVSNQSNLLVVVSIVRQGINGNSGELGEVFLDARSLLEEPLSKKSLFHVGKCVFL